MNSFSNIGKLTPKKCIGVFAHSEYHAAWIFYIKDFAAQKPHFYVEISYAAVPSGDRAEICELAKKLALSKGYDLVEIF